MAKHPGGRPRTLNNDQVESLVKAFGEYIDITEMPIIAEFAYKNEVNRQILYDYPEFSTLIKKAISKKETYLEREGLLNNINPTMAIFSLKQIGWRDKKEVSHDVHGSLNRLLHSHFIGEDE